MSNGCTCIKDYRVVCPYHPLDHDKVEIMGAHIRNIDYLLRQKNVELERLRAALEAVTLDADTLDQAYEIAQAALAAGGK